MHTVGLQNLQTTYNKPVHDCPVEIYKLTVIIYRQFAKEDSIWWQKKLTKSMNQKTRTIKTISAFSRERRYETLKRKQM